MKRILVQKNKIKFGSMWNFGSGLFREIGLSKSQMQTSIISLTNESSTSIIQIPSIATVKLEPTDNSIFGPLDSEDDICASIDLSDSLSFPLEMQIPLLHNFSCMQPNHYVVLST